MAEKKTEIVFSFELHNASALKKNRALFTDPNTEVILLEMDPHDAKAYLHGDKKVPDDVSRREYKKASVSILKTASSEGKKIIGVDPDPESWEKEDRESFRALEKEEKEAIEQEDVVREAFINAEMLRMRDRHRLECLKKAISDPSMKGKRIVIEAGASHEPLLLELKKALPKKQFIIQRTYANRGQFAKKAGFVPSPFESMVKAFRTKHPSAREPSKLSKLKKLDQKFKSAEARNESRLMRAGLTEEEAFGIANLRARNMLRRGKLK